MGIGIHTREIRFCVVYSLIKRVLLHFNIFVTNKRLRYRWGTAHQRQITLEVILMNYLQLDKWTVLK